MSENLRLYVHGLYTFDAVVQRATRARSDRAPATDFRRIRSRRHHHGLWPDALR